MMVGLGELAGHRRQVACGTGLDQSLIQTMQVPPKFLGVGKTVWIREVKAKSAIDLNVDKAGG